MHGARSTVLYCTVLRAFSHFHAIYRCFPYSCTLCKPHSQLKIDPTPTPLTPSMGVVKLRIETPLEQGCTLGPCGRRPQQAGSQVAAA